MRAISSPLPLNAAEMLERAARSMFQLLSSSSQGMLLVDVQGRIVWISDSYRRFLPALGAEDEASFIGRQVEDVIPNTQMHRVLQTGEAELIDLLHNQAGTFVVSRLPMRDDAGAIIGAVGIVLIDQPESKVQPLINKFALLQRDLDEARQELQLQRRRSLVLGDGQRRAKHTFASFIGTSQAASEVKRQARRAAQSSSPVLLLGETGTGKELLAHAIHAASSRAAHAFVGVNIAAIPESLLEAEFFGVAPGAYTGAERKGREGKFKLAHGGTLFLDEIGDMPANVQAKLLRALQEGEIEPLGSNQLIPVDVRVIAATSRDLHAMVRAGTFREDLFYRLHVLPMRVPPLRERRDDIAALVEVLMDDIALRNHHAPLEVLPDALALLAAQHWPGNVRELRNVLEQAALRVEGSAIDAAQLHAVLQQAGMQAVAPAPVVPGSGATVCPSLAPSNPSAPPTLRPLAEQVAELERHAIAAALQQCGGNKLQAAKVLGISRAKLYERLASTV